MDIEKFVKKFDEKRNQPKVVTSGNQISEEELQAARQAEAEAQAAAPSNDDDKPATDSSKQ